MLLLFESPAGFALFKVLDEGKLKQADVRAQLPDPRPCSPSGKPLDPHRGCERLAPLALPAGPRYTVDNDWGCALAVHPRSPEAPLPPAAVRTSRRRQLAAAGKGGWDARTACKQPEQGCSQRTVAPSPWRHGVAQWAPRWGVLIIRHGGAPPVALWRMWTNVEHTWARLCVPARASRVTLATRCSEADAELIDSWEGMCVWLRQCRLQLLTHAAWYAASAGHPEGLPQRRRGEEGALVLQGGRGHQELALDGSHLRSE